LLILNHSAKGYVLRGQGQTAVPPLKEQIAIADFLDRKTSMVDTMVSKIEGAIERIQEYRTALITAAVTGKIDVRGVVA
jgi:type I restriction enzyme S subunit